MTVSTLDAVPRPHTGRGTVSNAEPAPIHTYTATGTALQRAASGDYLAWLAHVRAAAGCTRPIRLVGTIDTLDPATGQRLARRHTTDMPDAAIYKACGNRRGSVCPACSGIYQADAYQLLRAGLVGGKGVPETVSKHPAVFPTLTAPSFGTVHRRAVKRHTCTNRRRCDCRPEPCHARREQGVCEHGRPAVCWARHEPGDAILGQPLCLDCYDHAHQVVWNLFSGELWRRTKQAAERYLAQLARMRGIPRVTVVTESGKVRRVPPVRLAHGKAAEFQARGAVHFHVLLRLDGVNGLDPAAVVPPSPGFTTVDLEDAIRHAAAQVAFHTPDHADMPGGWLIAWGDPDKGLEVRHITLTGRGEVTDGMVAGYLAKYATKSTEVTGHSSTRLDADTIDEHADADGDHTARLIDACWQLGRPQTTPRPLADRPRADRPAPGFRQRRECPDCGTHTRYAACPSCVAERQGVLDTETPNSVGRSIWVGLRRWAHMLGFGGHFLTKARRYSVTFQLLRDSRISYRREHDREDQADGVIRTADHMDEETTLVVGTLTYAGSGWHTTGDALLANTSAALARARHQAGREELAHELGSTIAGATPAAA
ncbi:replication initiator [Phytohabitans kaempferiae]|uniref:Replication initiator n=1 Tax=Phytohabitans kaempferiae TaxID=1620943 RepID=A0ABV6MFI8_9ACTN